MTNPDLPRQSSFVHSLQSWPIFNNNNSLLRFPRASSHRWAWPTSRKTFTYRLNSQGSFSLPKDLGEKTVDEVWKEIVLETIENPFRNRISGKEPVLSQAATHNPNLHPHKINSTSIFIQTRVPLNHHRQIWGREREWKIDLQKIENLRHGSLGPIRAKEKEGVGKRQRHGRGWDVEKFERR